MIQQSRLLGNPVGLYTKFEGHTPKALFFGHSLSWLEKQIPYSFTVYGDGSPMLRKSLEEVKDRLTSANRVAIGDLHGSYEKLLETLLASDLITLPKTSQQEIASLSKSLTDIFKQDALLQKKANRNKAKKITIALKERIKKIRWCGGDRQLLLVGDVVSDRSSLDTLTLTLIDKLTQNNPDRIVALASNHDLAAFHFLITGKYDLRIKRQEASLVRSFKLAETPEEEAALQDKYHRYLSRAVLMHYTPNTKTLYTHAPISPQNIKELIEEMKQENYLPDGYNYDTMTTADIEPFVKQSNRYYQDYIQSCLREKKLLRKDKRFMNFVWPRRSLYHEKDLPFKDKGVNVLVHGHDDGSCWSPFSIVKDNPQHYQVANLNQEIRKRPGKVGKGASRLFIEA